MKICDFILQTIGDKLISCEYTMSYGNKGSHKKIRGIVISCTDIMYGEKYIRLNTEITLQKENGTTQSVNVRNIINGSLKVHSENERLLFKISNNL